jgi:hypothetical protein
MADFLSFRAFAKLDRCSEALVRRAVKEKRLTPRADGLLDAALAGTAWRAGNLRTAPAHTEAPGAHSDSIAQSENDTPEDIAARITESATVIPPYAVSLARKEFFLAALREIEHDVAVRKVIPVAQVVEVFERHLADIKTRLRSIPSSEAPRLCRIRDPAVMQATLLDAIDDALRDLVEGAATAAAAG